jgi:hypothetical protein
MIAVGLVPLRNFFDHMTVCENDVLAYKEARAIEGGAS